MTAITIYAHLAQTVEPVDDAKTDKLYPSQGGHIDEYQIYQFGSGHYCL